MKRIVLIKYSLIFISIFCFYNCNNRSKKINPVKNEKQIIFKYEKKYIIKEEDSIFITRKYANDKNSIIDSVFLKINNKILLIKIPLITYYTLGVKKNIPHNKDYNYSDDDFLITATYRDFEIQYKFDYKLLMLKNIYMITNIDEVYPDFNKKPTDSIAKIEVLDIYQSKDLEKYLYQFENNIYNGKVKSNKTFYVLRKEDLKEIL